MTEIASDFTGMCFPSNVKKEQQGVIVLDGKGQCPAIDCRNSCEVDGKRRPIFLKLLHTINGTIQIDNVKNDMIGTLFF
jgi:hypothetical protein